MLLSIVELWIHNAVEHGFLGVSASLAGGAALYLAIHPWIPDFQGHSSSTQQVTRPRMASARYLLPHLPTIPIET